MSHQIQYRITTLSPILLTRIIGNTHVLTTHEYISGSAIRGMLANRYISKMNLGELGHEDERFYKWFLQGDLKFANAYVEGRDEYEEPVGFYPIPFSIQKEKNGNRIYDLLRKEDFPDQQTKNIEGFCRLNQSQLHTRKVRKSLSFHHVRNVESGTAQEGGFFNYEAIGSEQTFHGHVRGSQADLQDFSTFFDQSLYAYLGKSKNAQYGKVNFEIVSDKPQPFYSETGHSGDDVELEKGQTSLTLLADTIIYNENGFPSTDFRVLQKYLNTTISKAFVKTGDTENFVSVWRLRKPSEHCFLAGSCFLIEITDDNKVALLKFLKDGLGERCHEGFGRIALDWQTEEALQESEFQQGKLPKPGSDSEIPQTTRRILHGTVASLISQAVELYALQNAAEFRDAKKANQGFPSKSLIGRLELMLKLHRKDPVDNTFKKSLEKLRDKKAEKTLNACRSENLRKTLWDYLQGYDVPLQAILNNVRNEQIKTMANEVNFNLENTPFKTEMYCKYLEVFFSAMRKLQKPSKEVQND